MKYELNTPYKLEVKNVTEKDNLLVFEVEIGGNLFPVQAYPEQLEGGVPSIISCRIIQDKNKDAFLVQNEAFFYPAIYKPNRKYLFEVVGIKDTYVVLQDKYGIYHAMEKDGSLFSLNEIIIRCVEIVKENDYKAHLIFFVPETEEEANEIQENQIATSEEHIQTHYAPTIFEEDPLTPSPSQEDNQAQVSSVKSKQNSDASHNANTVSVCSMLLSEEWENAIIYFRQNLKGAKIRSVQEEVGDAILKCFSPALYWKIIKFLLDYDSNIFLFTLAKTGHSHISDLDNSIDDKILDDIIKNAFKDSGKAKYSLEILMPCKKHLTTVHRNYIQERCAGMSSYEAFYNLFKLLSFSPDDAVLYLLSLQDNIVAAYTLYKFYADGLKKNCLNEKSIYMCFRPSKILEYTKMMEKTPSIAFKTAAVLINCKVLSKGECPYYLQKEINENEFEGFKKYIQRNKIVTKKKNLFNSLLRGDVLNGLTFIRNLDNYYLLFDENTGAYALLDKNYTIRKPSPDVKVQAILFRKMNNKGNYVLIVVQKTVPTMYTFPPIVNNTTVLELGFSEHNGIWYPEVKHFSKLINAEIISAPDNIDYKIRHKAVITRRKDFFTYYVKILGNAPLH